MIAAHSFAIGGDVGTPLHFLGDDSVVTFQGWPHAGASSSVSGAGEYLAGAR